MALYKNSVFFVDGVIYVQPYLYSYKCKERGTK